MGFKFYYLVGAFDYCSLMRKSSASLARSLGDYLFNYYTGVSFVMDVSWYNVSVGFVGDSGMDVISKYYSGIIFSIYCISDSVSWGF